MIDKGRFKAAATDSVAKGEMTPKQVGSLARRVLGTEADAFLKSLNSVVQLKGKKPALPVKAGSAPQLSKPAPRPLPGRKPQQPKIVIPEEGPGTELMKLLEEVKLSMGEGCSCGKRKALMNLWGVVGSTSKREEIIGWLKEAATKVGWLTKATSGARLFIKPWFKTADPYGCIVDEAIRRFQALSKPPEP